MVIYIVSIPLGTINTIRKETGKSVKHVSIPLGTINTMTHKAANKTVAVSIPLGTINTYMIRGGLSKISVFQFH